MKYWQFPLVILSVLVLSVFSLAYVKEREREEPPEPIFEIPDFSFEISDGGRFSKQNMLGKLTILSFFFTSCPATCPAINSEISRLARQNQTESELQFVSVSLDPKRDTPEKINAYAMTYRSDPTQWRFLRGPQEDVDALLAALKLGMGPDISAHTTRLILIDRQAMVLGYYDPFDDSSLERLQTHLEGLG